MPIGASSKAERKRSSASASAACECMRSATSRTVAWVSTRARVAGSRTTRSRVSTHTAPAGRRIRWVIETGASSRPPSTAATPAASSSWTRSVNARPSSASGSSPSRSRQAGDA